MTELRPLVEELHSRVKWQRVPETIEYDELRTMVVNAIKNLYVVTGRGDSLASDAFTEDNFNGTLLIDEIMYVLAVAQIDFFRKVQTSLNDMVGYSTDALSITGADKGFGNIQKTIDALNEERKIYYYKMTRYTI